MLIVMLQAACATSPTPAGRETSAENVTAEAGASRQQAPPVTDRQEPFRLDFEGAAPSLQGSDDDEALAGHFSLGIDRMIRYSASWSLEPGDIWTADDMAPTRFAGQQLGHNVNLLLPELAGAPLAFEIGTEIENSWLVNGATGMQRDQARLRWSPGAADVNVQWAGNPVALDNTTALTCDLQSSVRVPTHQGSNHSEALRFSGRDCVVADESAAYEGLEAQRWGLSYVWSGSERQSEALLSVVDPAWSASTDLGPAAPGYEFGLSHRRDYGSLSARAVVSWRRPPEWEGPMLSDASIYRGGDGTDLAADASLTWQLADADLSARWASGIDRFWFTPDVGQQSDQFGLALNLSRWIESFIPYSSPQLAMNWDWSEVRRQDAGVTGNNAVRLDVSLMF